ncbi:MAG: hypothetical protein KDE53_32655, partial [Caldilineaceae bacterium]|nr:hypothetical protein [Caldilineaceae bacterium]
LSVWVKRNGSGHNDFILSQGQEGNRTAFSLGYRETDHLRCSIWGKSIDSASTYADTDWHHTICTFDATTHVLRLYQDATLVGEATTSGAYIGTGPLYIGRRFDNTRYLDGSVDEIAIYQRTLTTAEIANLYAYGQGTWEAATLTDGAWRYAIPTGADGLEGLYQLNVRGIDAVDNVTPQGGQRVWRGEIDTRPPVISFSVQVETIGNAIITTYTCRATDFSLDSNMGCRVSGSAPGYRPSDETLTPYAQVDPWYAAVITDTARIYGIDAERSVDRELPNLAALSVQVCDYYAHCTTAPAVLQPGPSQRVDSEILMPSDHTVLTSTNTITMTGVTHAESGLALMVVDVDGEAIFVDDWTGADVTDVTWSFTWTPPGEGIYEFVPHLDDLEGDDLEGTNLEGAEGAIQVDSTAQFPTMPTESEDEPDRNGGSSLPRVLYLPLAVKEASAPAQSNSGATALYLPVVANGVGGAGTFTNIFTGDTTRIYVDLKPPSIEIDATPITAADGFGPHSVLLSGSASDGVLLHEVEVRIDEGPWVRAGIQPDGRWSLPWSSYAGAAGETIEVTARATDIAGRTTVATAHITVDLVPPTPGDVRLTYVNQEGGTLPVAPSQEQIDATMLGVSWDAAHASDGPVTYAVGFSTSNPPADADLTQYDAPGIHTLPVSAGERWYATVRYVDGVGNMTTVTQGPFWIDVSGE